MVQQYPRRLARLKALAEKLEADYDDAPLTIRPQIAGQLRSTLADIAALEGPEVGTETASTEEDPVEAARKALEKRRGKGWSSSLLPRRMLHSQHASLVLSMVWAPPLLMGTTCSTVARSGLYWCPVRGVKDMILEQ